ncbi:hypothetical protein IL992_29520 [Microbispora sp. NEAU-D428]|uniref:arsenate reductase/protein-tyrosine-phosphatase family protein n=1 Tax=Microbispora sitophila TaxID=2771537 RepID=UPI001868B618|nr:hypothetical protein [Microbispora sitophila]MBE3013291.1 hypothetical protein [Microbispora sitophila]
MERTHAGETATGAAPGEAETSIWTGAATDAVLETPEAPETGEEPARKDAGTFRVLFVCTGNICRSAMAERLTLAALGPGSPILVRSAGTRARTGWPMAERAREVLLRLGADPEGFSSRPLTAEAVADADLVLAASSEHRAEAVALHPRAAACAFTIAEFGALARAVPLERVLGRGDPVGRARALLEEAGALRGLVRVDQPDIADPYGGSRRAYREAARRIADALAVPMHLLRRASAP